MADDKLPQPFNENKNQNNLDEVIDNTENLTINDDEETYIVNDKDDILLTSELRQNEKKKLESGIPYIYNEENDGKLENWDGFTPSNCYVDNGTSYIEVYPKGLTCEDVFPITEKEREDLQSEFKEQKPKNSKTLERLAIKYKMLTGKWMIIVNWSNKADEIWQKLAKLVYTREIPNALQLSINAHDLADENIYREDAKINILSKDFTDEKDVLELRDILRQTGIKGTMTYKPDVYTICEIYKDNEFKIKQFLHISKGQKVEKV